MTISREQVTARLREADFHFKDRTDRVEIYRQNGTGQRVVVSLRKHLPEKYIRQVLSQARLTPAQIEHFIVAAIKEQ